MLISKLKCYYVVMTIIIIIIVIIMIIIVIKIILIMPDLTNFKRPFITLLVIYRNKRLRSEIHFGLICLVLFWQWLLSWDHK